jgi:Flp pilus assembly protein CpaB
VAFVQFRRGPVFSARAAVGGLLVTLALLGVSQAYARADQPPSTTFAVATRTVPPGARLGPGAVDPVPVDLPPALAARAFGDPEVLDGAVTLAPLQEGDLVLASHVAPGSIGPPAGVELSFSVSPDRAVAGGLRPGEQVDLVATYGSGDPATARLVATGALVVAVQDGGGGLLGGEAGLTLTVRLAQRSAALDLVHAVDLGSVTVLRSTGSDRP